MKAVNTLALLFAAALCFWSMPTATLADGKIEILDDYPDIAEKLDNGAQGREFWIAIPPNESQTVNAQTRALEIYVTSGFDTEVTMEVPGLGVGPRTKAVKAGEITTFTDAPEGADMSWAYEVRRSEMVTAKGILLTAGKPISVYVFSAKRFTSEGYLALPTSVWGKEYMHLSYYDYPEPSVVRGGGFLIVAREDDTQIEFKLSGTSSFGTTIGGASVGADYDVTLAKGQTYLVQGDGNDRTFDISGTRIKGNKAFGLISFHMRTIIPTALGFSSRDNLMEMMPPVSSWGREFVTTEYKRNNKGDYFRIIAAEDNTEFSVNYYDQNSKALLGTRAGVINSGEWREYEEVNPTPETESIRGVAVWKADKPVLLMQYSYSTGWDNAQEYDPFMILVPSVDQYILGTTFQTPSRADFNTNWFNIIAQGDPDDPEAEKLKSLHLDGKAIWKLDPKFLVNQIPGTDKYWAQVNLSPGAHQVIGKTLFGGAIYGFSPFESYGWPAGVAINKIDEPDDSAPTIAIEEDEETNGEFNITVSETNNDGDVQIDQGIAAVELLENHSTNYQIQMEQAITPGEVVKSVTFRLFPVDRSKDGDATILVRDRAGNVAIQSVEYAAKYITVPNVAVEFGGVRLGKEQIINVTLTNPTKGPVAITGLALAKAEVFSFEETPVVPFTIEAGQQHDIAVRYQPNNETGENGQEADTDELLIDVEGNPANTVAIQGRGVQPHISVREFSFPPVELGQEICDSEALLVRNSGTDVLVVSGIEGMAVPFRLANDVVLPLSIPVGEERLLGTVCFQSFEDGEFSTTVSIISDAPAGDPNSATLSGRTLNATDVTIREAGLFTLYQNNPNPASGATTIEFNLQQSMPVTLHLYNSLGRKVTTLADGLRPAGLNRLVFSVAELPDGLYYYTLAAGEEQATLGMLIAR